MTQPLLVVLEGATQAFPLVLADRVVVLSTRPATVLADIRIEEPKPRSDAWLRSPQHDVLERRILTLIRDARPKAMASGQLRVEV